MCQATRPASLLRRSDILLAILWLSCPSVPQCFTASCQSPAKPAPQLATPGPQELRTMTRRLLSAGIGDQVRLVQQARSRVPWRSMQIYADMYFAFKRAGRVEGTQASHRRGEAATKPTVRRQDLGPAILQADTRILSAGGHTHRSRRPAHRCQTHAFHKSMCRWQTKEGVSILSQPLEMKAENGQWHGVCVSD